MYKRQRADCAGATLGLDGAITNPLALVDIVAIGKLLIADSNRCSSSRLILWWLRRHPAYPPSFLG